MKCWDWLKQRWDGLRVLKERLGNTEIGYEASGGIEVFSESDRTVLEECLDRMKSINIWLKPVIGEKEVFCKMNKSAAGMGMAGVTDMILNVAEGQIHTEE